MCDAIRASRADLLFVAMSSPRKEYFLGEYGPDLGVPFVMGVGGSIDVIAGVTRRAPAAWQRLGLEWLFRLLQEPRRMFRRYAVTNTRFIALVGLAMLSGHGGQAREHRGNSHDCDRCPRPRLARGDSRSSTSRSSRCRRCVSMTARSASSGASANPRRSAARPGTR